MVVNNAGYGIAGALEELTDEQVRAQFDTTCSASATFCAPSCRSCGVRAAAMSSTVQTGRPPLRLPLGPDALAGAFAGKTVIDTTNYYPDRDGRFPELDRGAASSSELVADDLREATVVKVFNTIYFSQIRSDARPGDNPKQRRALPVAGDDAASIEQVSALIDHLGLTPVPSGSLADSARQQPGGPAYNVALTEIDRHRALGAA